MSNEVFKINDFGFTTDVESVLDLPDNQFVAQLPLPFTSNAHLQLVTKVRCIFTVQAGSYPNEPNELLTKKWIYTAMELKKDQFPPADELTIFHKMQTEAQDYSNELRTRNEVNWVNLDWVWVT